jgi:DNA-directed RNA polymerase subunit H (RpoH/RPB5)
MESFLMTHTQIKDTLISNVLKMLSRRIYTKNYVEEPLLILNSNSNDNKELYKDLGDDIYEIITNDTPYYLKIYFQKINSIKKPSTIQDFLNKYSTFEKIIIAQEFGNKVLNTFNKTIRLQIFKEVTLMDDVNDFHLQPKYDLLTYDEMNKVKDEYLCNDKHFRRAYADDVIAGYFNLKPGDIIRVITPSPTAGEVVSYIIITKDKMVL